MKPAANPYTQQDLTMLGSALLEPGRYCLASGGHPAFKVSSNKNPWLSSLWLDSKTAKLKALDGVTLPSTT